MIDMVIIVCTPAPRTRGKRLRSPLKQVKIRCKWLMVNESLWDSIAFPIRSVDRSLFSRLIVVHSVGRTLQMYFSNRLLTRLCTKLEGD